MKRYGPYRLRSGHWFWIEKDGKRRKSILVHRETLEKKIRRQLDANEICHHIDGNPDNNDPSNLEVMSRAAHASHHHAGTAEIWTAYCLECGVRFERASRFIRHNQNVQKKTGPFCGKSCSGKWSRRKQIEAGRSNLRIQV